MDFVKNEKLRVTKTVVSRFSLGKVNQPRKRAENPNFSITTLTSRTF